MMMNTTLNQLRGLRLETMAQALEQQLSQSGISAMSFEERLALLVDREVHGRQDRRCARLLKTAKLKYPQAAIEDLDSRSTRGIERSAVMSLALGEWVNAGHAVLITGATGAGKSWLACALAQHGFIIKMLRSYFCNSCGHQAPGQVDDDGYRVLKLPNDCVARWSNVHGQYFVEHQRACHFNCNSNAVEHAGFKQIHASTPARRTQAAITFEACSMPRCGPMGRLNTQLWMRSAMGSVPLPWARWV